MSSTKKLVAAVCLVLCVCVAMAAFCFYNAGSGGYGPKVKGFRLGQKVTARDFFNLGKNEGGSSFTLYFFSDTHYERTDSERSNYLWVRFNTAENKCDFGGSLYGKFSNFRTKKEWTIDKILTELDKVGFRQVGRYSGNYYVLLSEDGVITKMHFRMYAFVDSPLDVKTEDFAGTFMSSYNIPNLERVAKDKWQYKNFSEGWQVTVGNVGAIIETLSTSSSSSSFN